MTTKRSSISSSSSKLGAWLQAARPLAQLNVFAPLAFGEALAYALWGSFGLGRFALVHVYGVLIQLFIVFANDCADWDTDTKNRTYNAFSGGSRVIPEGKLTPNALGTAALAVLVAAGVLSAFMTVALELVWMLILCWAAAALLWVYSFPPLKLSYRGGGEVLQGLGVGVVLPLTGFYVQCGSLFTILPQALAAGFLLGTLGNVLTSLPDAPSDAKSGKRTFAVRHGQRAARFTVVGGLVLAAAFVPVLGACAPAWLLAAVAAVMLAPVALSLRDIQRADAEDTALCYRFTFLNGAAILLGWLGYSVVVLAR